MLFFRGSCSETEVSEQLYLFGSYAYGQPTEKSDIDIYIVTPDEVNNFSELYTQIIVDLSYKNIFFIDLLLSTESVFNIRKNKNIFEDIIVECGFLNRFANDIRYPHKIVLLCGSNGG